MTAAAFRYWALDVEGSGTTPPEIVELAAVEIVNLQLTGQTRTWRIKPSKPITRMATSIHGIRNQNVVDCPPFAEVSEDIESVISEGLIVGHNIHVELAFPGRALPTWRPRIAVDTLRLTKALRPGLPSYGLDQVGHLLSMSQRAQQITGQKHHSALYDATLAALVMAELLTELPESQRESALRSADIFDQPQGSLL